MTTKISLEELLESGAHFGHQTKRWNPKMEEYLYGQEKGVHIFDLTKTKLALEEALEYIKKSVSEGKLVLLLGTKKQIKEKVSEVGKDTGMPVITERWLGGTISNFDQIKKSLKKLADMKAKMIEGAYNEFTKKERLLIEREIARLDRFFGGLTGLEKVPEILFVVDTKKEAPAVREASRTKVTIIGIVDSNSDPDMIDYPIPMNDDASRGMTYVLDLVKSAILDGKAKHKPVKKA
jgi:small subunit ribosomal protein S2